MKRKKENEMFEQGQGKEQEQVGEQGVMGSVSNGNQSVQPEMYIDFDTDGMHVIVEVGEAELDFLLNKEEIKSLMQDMEQWIKMAQGEGQSESGANA
jgi:hypothetical protein